MEQNALLESIESYLTKRIGILTKRDMIVCAYYKARACADREQGDMSWFDWFDLIERVDVKRMEYKKNVKEAKERERQEAINAGLVSMRKPRAKPRKLPKDEALPVSEGP